MQHFFGRRKKCIFFAKKVLTRAPPICYIKSCLVEVTHGGVAQLARACGSYPQCHRFESSRRYHHRRDVKTSRRYPSRGKFRWPVGQVVKTRPFHGCNMGSSPVRVTNGGLAQLVRAPASHAGGHWFESSSLHQILGNLVFPRIFSFSDNKKGLLRILKNQGTQEV